VWREKLNGPRRKGTLVAEGKRIQRRPEKHIRKVLVEPKIAGANQTNVRKKENGRKRLQKRDREKLWGEGNFYLCWCVYKRGS